MFSITEFIYVMITILLCWKAGKNDAMAIVNSTNPQYNSPKDDCSPDFSHGVGVSCESENCLAGDGLARLASGGHKKVSEPQAGDRVLAMDQNNLSHIIETDVIMIMHRVSTEYSLYQNKKPYKIIKKRVIQSSDLLSFLRESKV